MDSHVWHVTSWYLGYFSGSASCLGDATATSGSEGECSQPRRRLRQGQRAVPLETTRHRLSEVGHEPKKASADLYLLLAFLCGTAGRWHPAVTVRFEGTWVVVPSGQPSFMPPLHTRLEGTMTALTVSQASNLLSLRAGVTLAVLGIVIPSLSNFLVQRLSLGDNGKDKCLTQACGILAALGMIFIFFARSSAPLIAGQFLFSLGNSFGVPARSLTAGLVEQRHLGTVFTLVTVITMSGAFAAGPLLAGAFAWGMSLGEVWSGMPFLVAGVCFSLGTLAVSATDSGQVPRQCDDGEQGNDV